MGLPSNHRCGAVVGVSGSAAGVGFVDGASGLVCGLDDPDSPVVGVDSEGLLGVVVSPGDVDSVGLVGVVVVVLVCDSPVRTFVRGTQV
jgi:hypothetical protein